MKSIFMFFEKRPHCSTGIIAGAILNQYDDGFAGCSEELVKKGCIGV